MCCARNNRAGRRAGERGFTLIEVMLGVMIMALMMVAIYRFIETDLQGITISQEVTAKETSARTLVAVVKGELQAIPQGATSALAGQPHMFQQQSADEMTWLAEPGPGNGLFTKYFSGEYNATLTIVPNPKTRQSDLGLWRSPLDAQTRENWLALIPNVRALEIRYYDSNLNAWVDTWSDANNRPKMVRLRLWREKDAAPYEAVIALPLRGQVSYTDGGATAPAAGPSGSPGGRNGRVGDPNNPQNPRGPGNGGQRPPRPQPQD